MEGGCPKPVHRAQKSSRNSDTMQEVGVRIVVIYLCSILSLSHEAYPLP